MIFASKKLRRQIIMCMFVKSVCVSVCVWQRDRANQTDSMCVGILRK